MCQNTKKGHNCNCYNNNCRVHHNHNPNFFSCYPYPSLPCYGCAMPPLVQYSIPQPSSPLFAQYRYLPIIQQPVAGLEPIQGFIPGHFYQYRPNNVKSNFNNLPNNLDINYNSYSQPFGENYYDARFPIETGQSNNDFRRSALPLNAEEEYNWAVHISEILDEFVGRNRSRPKSNFDEYKKLKQTLAASMRHLKEAEVLNQALVNTWAKKDKKQRHNSSQAPILEKNFPEITKVNNNNIENLSNKSNVPSSPLPGLKQKTYQPVVLNEKKVIPITQVITPTDNKILEENKAEDKSNFVDDNGKVIDNHNEIIVADSSVKPLGDVSKQAKKVSPAVTADINDFLGNNPPEIALLENNFIESNAWDEKIKFVDIDTVKDTRPVGGTYEDYSIKTSLGKIQASQIYPKIFDEYGHLKMDHFEAIAQFGLTEKQYNTLISNFYSSTTKQSKKIKKNKFNGNNKAKFNNKVFWITMSILLVILLLIGITFILYFTVPSVTEGINSIIYQIKNLF